jgi:hypothetical protein
MADLDFLDLGFSESELLQPESAYEKLILAIANQVTQEFKEYILANASNNGALAQSVVYFPTGAMSFEIQADDYYKFQDEGVSSINGAKFNTPYSFRLPYVTKSHAVALQKWKGYDLSHAYASAYVTKHKYGIKPKNITANVMTDDVLNRIASDLAEVTGLMFQVTFTKNTQSWQ